MTRRLSFVLPFMVLWIVSCSCESYEDALHNANIFSLSPQETRHVKPRAFQSQYPPQNLLGGQGGQAEQGAAYRGGSDNAHAPSQQQQLRRPMYPEETQAQGLYQNAIPARPLAQVRRPQKGQTAEELEDELEQEEPDRLSQLLPNSKFDCGGRNTGYYADEGLACEIFHYCQDDTKHSWICPDGFTFHQVHLICMPPSGDNICQKSSQYTFVNDYLYKPLNAEEAYNRPNVTLRYSDRFYPAEVYHDGRYDEEDDEEPQRSQQQVPAPRRQPPRPAQVVQQAPPPARRPQVFRSPEEVDIPLLQRRPAHPPQPFHPANNHDFEYEKK